MRGWHVALLWLAASTASADSLGRAIFERGEGRASRPVGGAWGAGMSRTAGPDVACANCHGAQGRGGREGFVRAPDIRWSTLTSAQGAVRSDGHVRPPYDVVSFARAVRTGVAAGGEPLDVTMPRFDLGDDEVEALVEQLSSLGEVAHARRPVLVTLVPDTHDANAEAVLHGLQNCSAASSADAETARIPALRVVRYGDLAALDRELGQVPVAAFFAPYLVGQERAYELALRKFADRVPTLLPLSPLSLSAPTLALFVLPGVLTQATALAKGVHLDATSALGLWSDDADPTVVRLLAKQLKRLGLRVRVIHEPDAVSAHRGPMLALAPLPPAVHAPGVNEWLVPAIFLQAEQAASWTRLGVRVRVAAPYPPKQGSSARWIPPTRAWSAIGCELLARLPVLPADARELSAWRLAVARQTLHLQDWLTLPARGGDQVARVALQYWEP